MRACRRSEVKANHGVSARSSHPQKGVNARLSHPQQMGVTDSTQTPFLLWKSRLHLKTHKSLEKKKV
jgi:hypothetical protein